MSAALRVAAAIWQRHYHVPEPAYWLGLLLSAAATFAFFVTEFAGALFDGEPFDRQFVGGITLTAIAVIALVVCGTGIVRWQRDRRRAGDGLVVARFYEFAGAQGRADDAQLTILDSLRQNLPGPQAARVHGIQAVVDLEHQKFAARLLRRLRAGGLLHGRAVDRSVGGWTVHARLALPAQTGLTHYDWHTNDRTPGRMPWRAWFSRLPSTIDVTDEEFPLDLTRDLETLVRGTAGAVGLASTPAEAEQLLRDALEASPDSTTPAVDVLRVQLALATFFQDDREDEALDLLRERRSQGDAFGELLRGFAFLADLRRRQIDRELNVEDEISALYDDGEDEPDDEDLAEEADLESFTPQQLKMLDSAENLERQADQLRDRAHKLEREAEKLYNRVLEFEDENYEAYVERLRALDAQLSEEIISALRDAAADETDPRRDISLYNLINVLLGAAGEADDKSDEADTLREDAWRKLDELRARSSYYRKAWYVKRLCGLRGWLRFERIAAEHAGPTPEGIGAAREAAKWYSRAIRARPRFGLVRFADSSVWARYRVRSLRSPILDANAFDAHFYGKHRWRALYHQFRFFRRRRALWRGAHRDLRNGYLNLAEAQLDWAVVGRHRPERDRYDAVEAAATAARDRVAELRAASPGDDQQDPTGDRVGSS
jgi:hypothetical protein